MRSQRAAGLTGCRWPPVSGDEYAYIGLPTGKLSASPEVATAAYEVQRKELEQWDKKHPELDVSTFKSKGPNV